MILLQRVFLTLCFIHITTEAFTFSQAEYKPLYRKLVHDDIRTSQPVINTRRYKMPIAKSVQSLHRHPDQSHKQKDKITVRRRKVVPHIIKTRQDLHLTSRKSKQSSRKLKAIKSTDDISNASIVKKHRGVTKKHTQKLELAEKGDTKKEIDDLSLDLTSLVKKVVADSIDKNTLPINHQSHNDLFERRTQFNGKIKTDRKTAEVKAVDNPLLAASLGSMNNTYTKKDENQLDNTLKANSEKSPLRIDSNDKNVVTSDVKDIKQAGTLENPQTGDMIKIDNKITQSGVDTEAKKLVIDNPSTNKTTDSESKRDEQLTTIGETPDDIKKLSTRRSSFGTGFWAKMKNRLNEKRKKKNEELLANRKVAEETNKTTKDVTSTPPIQPNKPNQPIADIKDVSTTVNVPEDKSTTAIEKSDDAMPNIFVTALTQIMKLNKKKQEIEFEKSLNDDSHDEEKIENDAKTRKVKENAEVKKINDKEIKNQQLIDAERIKKEVEACQKKCEQSGNTVITSESSYKNNAQIREMVFRSVLNENSGDKKDKNDKVNGKTQGTHENKNGNTNQANNKATTTPTTAASISHTPIVPSSFKFVGRFVIGFIFLVVVII